MIFRHIQLQLFAGLCDALVHATETAFGDSALTPVEEVCVETVSRYVTSVCENPTEGVVHHLAIELRLAIRAPPQLSKMVLMKIASEARGYRGDEQAKAALDVQKFRKQSLSAFFCSAFNRFRMPQSNR